MTQETPETTRTEMTAGTEMTEEPTSGRDWSEFVPDVDLPRGNLDGYRELFDEFGIVAAYRKWCGKSEPVPGTRTEGIMVSCPKPDHPDHNPSAWLNTDKNLWHCGACDEGGDIIDLGAIHYGIDRRTASKREFVELVETLLTGIGVDVEALRAHNAEKAAAKEAANPTITAVAGTLTSGTETSVTVNDEEVDGPEDLPDGLEAVELQWQEIIDTAPNTFLKAWMTATSPSDIPNEFLFWNGMQLLGLVSGRDSYLLRNSRPIYPNLFVAHIGRTGSGKSRSIGLAKEVMHDALPFDINDPASKGVRFIGRPGSGEALYELFSWQPDNEYRGLRGWVEIDEMSELMKAANRSGSTLKEAVITLGDSPQRKQHPLRGGTIEIVEPFMALVTGGQPEAMSQIMSGVDQASGFANRFIYVQGTPKPMVSWNEEADIDLAGLPELLQSVRVWTSNSSAGRPITLNRDAADRFDMTRTWLEEVRERPNGDMFARLNLHATKLIAILCINRKTALATVEIVEQVHHLIESLVPATQQVSESISKTEAEYYRTKVLACIDRKQADGDDPPTITMLKNHPRTARRDELKTGEAVAFLRDKKMISEVRLNTGNKNRDRPYRYTRRT